MKVIILAGGLGTRLAEETTDKPKPMVRIGEQPILWHIMNIFVRQGLSHFVIAAGYKMDVIVEWLKIADLPWTVDVVDTGQITQTGGRIKKCIHKIGKERVIATYGDGLANVSINQQLEFHQGHGRLATVTAVRPPARFGHLEVVNDTVVHFGEKNQSDVGWINGGFFILEPQVAEYINSDEEPFETGALPRLVNKGELKAFSHFGFWQPMDTIRERDDLSRLARNETPPWLSGI